MSSTSITRRSALKLGAGAMAVAAGATMMASSRSGIARADEAEGAVFSEPGTYTAEGPGRYGQVIVTMTASADAIESIETDSNETKLIGGYALEVLTDQVTKFQSVDFDTISGATFTCNAFRTALTSCIEQAGGDVSKLQNEIIIDPVEYETSADILIIGAGGSGLSAALTAAEAGASVIVIDKAPLYGGNTNASHSGINVVNSKVLEELGGTSDDVEGFIEVQTNDYVNPAMVERFAEISGPAADWIAGLGVEFTLADNNDYQLKCEEPGSRTGVSIMRTLLEKLSEQPDVNIYLNTTANALVVDDSGAVCGIQATGADGQDLNFTGSAVIMATGGYGQNHDFVVECRPDYVNAITDEIAPTTGDGIFMSEDINADTVDLDQLMIFNRIAPVYGMVISADVPGGRSTPAGIYVNKQAQRIGGETSLEDSLMLDQEDGTMYHIFPSEYDNETIGYMLATGFAWQADSPEALAEAMGLDPEALAETVATWNESAVDGVDAEYGRDDAGVVPLEGTITGYCFRLGVHFCMGGLKFDENCHVIDNDGNAIPQFFACGECTGGVHGNKRVDGSALCDAFAFGHLAGQVAAEAVLA